MPEHGLDHYINGLLREHAAKETARAFREGRDLHEPAHTTRAEAEETYRRALDAIRANPADRIDLDDLVELRHARGPLDLWQRQYLNAPPPPPPDGYVTFDAERGRIRIRGLGPADGLYRIEGDEPDEFGRHEFAVRRVR